MATPLSLLVQHAPNLTARFVVEDMLGALKTGAWDDDIARAEAGGDSLVETLLRREDATQTDALVRGFLARGARLPEREVVVRKTALHVQEEGVMPHLLDPLNYLCLTDVVERGVGALTDHDDVAAWMAPLSNGKKFAELHPILADQGRTWSSPFLGSTVLRTVLSLGWTGESIGWLSEGSRTSTPKRSMDWLYLGQKVLTVGSPLAERMAWAVGCSCLGVNHGTSPSSSMVSKHQVALAQRLRELLPIEQCLAGMEALLADGNAGLQGLARHAVREYLNREAWLAGQGDPLDVSPDDAERWWALAFAVSAEPPVADSGRESTWKEGVRRFGWPPKGLDARPVSEQADAWLQVVDSLAGRIQGDQRSDLQPVLETVLKGLKEDVWPRVQQLDPSAASLHDRLRQRDGVNRHRNNPTWTYCLAVLSSLSLGQTMADRPPERPRLRL